MSSSDHSLLSNVIAANIAAAAKEAALAGPVNDGLPVLTPFDLSGRTVLVTGGGSGIGLALVEQFIKHGASTVIITGRRECVLQSAQKHFPKTNIQYFVSDAGKESDRVELFAKVSKAFPELSVLVNNAGVQSRQPLATSTTEWKVTQDEIDINFAAPIHLSNLFAPLLLKQKSGAAIVHITSGLSSAPYPAAPVYSATKAALHSFIISQRISFEGSCVRVVELSPPAVKSNLGGAHDFGEDAGEFAASVFARWTKGEQEVGYKTSEMWRTKGRLELIEQANKFAQMVQLPRYKNAF